MSVRYLKCDIQTRKHDICHLLLFLAREKTTVRRGLFLQNYLRGKHAACFHYFIKFIIPRPWEETLNGIWLNHS